MVFCGFSFRGFLPKGGSLLSFFAMLGGESSFQEDDLEKKTQSLSLRFWIAETVSVCPFVRLSVKGPSFVRVLWPILRKEVPFRKMI